MNKPIARTEIETVISKLPTNKISRTRWLHRWIPSNIYRDVNTYTSEIISKICRGKKTPKLIIWDHHHPDKKIRPIHHTQKRKLQANISDEHRCEHIQKLLANQLQQYSKRIIHYVQVGFIPGMQEFFKIHKSIIVIHDLTKLKNKNHRLISIDE